MSVRVMAEVWDADLDPHLKFVLLAYADHANDDGTSVFPGEDRMVHKTGYSVASVRRITRELIEAGVLDRTKPGHRGQRAEYRVNVDAVKALQKASHNDRQSGESLSPSALMPITGDTPNHQDPSVLSLESASLRDVIEAEHGKPANAVEGRKRKQALEALTDAGVTGDEYRQLYAYAKRIYSKAAFATPSAIAGNVSTLRDGIDATGPPAPPEPCPPGSHRGPWLTLDMGDYCQSCSTLVEIEAAS